MKLKRITIVTWHSGPFGTISVFTNPLLTNRLLAANRQDVEVQHNNTRSQTILKTIDHTLIIDH